MPSINVDIVALTSTQIKSSFSDIVTFDETVFPFGSMTPTTPPSYDFLVESSNFISNIIRSTPISNTNNNTTIPTVQSNIPTEGTPSTQPAQQNHSVQQHNLNATVTPLIHPNNTPELTQPAQHHTSNASPSQLNNSPPKIIDPPVNPNPVSTYAMVTRFRVGTNHPTQRLTLHVSPISHLPKSYVDAFNDPNWQNAMQDEYIALIINNIWSLVPRPMDAYFVRCMWLFRHKYLADGTLSRYKARLVANGSTRIESKLEDDGDPVSNPTLYRSLAGSLQYLTFTHPDISDAVQQVYLYMHDPREHHFSALKRILRYVRGTLDYGL
ncbi:ribonuclease H-like domain-containing protein [Tanacetum coccineum]